MSSTTKSKLKYVYIVDMSAQREGAHCQGHVLGVHRTLQSAKRHYDMIHKDRLSARHFIREFWATVAAEKTPPGHPARMLRAFLHESWYADEKRERYTEQVALTRRLLSPVDRRVTRGANK